MRRSIEHQQIVQRRYPYRLIDGPERFDRHLGLQSILFSTLLPVGTSALRNVEIRYFDLPAGISVFASDKSAQGTFADAPFWDTIPIITDMLGQNNYSSYCISTHPI